MNILITGSAGFVGGVLTTHALEAGHSVLGIDIKTPETAPAGSEFELCDVRDGDHLERLIAGFRPERVFHLAAQSFPTVSLAQPWETMEINAGGTVRLFETLRSVGISPVVVVACSSAEYGPVDAADLPVREGHPLRPLHPYGVSKVAQDLLAYQYFVNYGIPTVRIRIFNTTGPTKVGDVCSDLTKRAAEIELGLRPPKLPVGNTNTRRALQDVRDLVSALWVSADRCEPGEVYNVGGSRAISVQEVIERIQELATRPFEIVQEPALTRACDEPVIWGDTSRFAQATGWAPTVDVADTIGHMLDWWRNRLSSQVEVIR